MRDRILAHRGLWRNKQDHNSLDAIVLALASGFGVEIDLRDDGGNVVISHDPPPQSGTVVHLDELLAQIPREHLSWVAFNIKSDGLSALLPRIEFKHFYFDMSFPERMRYVKHDHPIADRVSDLEPLNFLRELPPETAAVWVDAFESDWFTDSAKVNDILQMPVMKFFVSPELHGREPTKAWETLRYLMSQREDVGICTDYPERYYEGF